MTPRGGHWVHACLLLASLDPASVALAGPPGPSAPTAIDLGRRMYRDGVRPNGEPMEAVVLGDARLQGPSAACASCHRRSGMGSSEGSAEVPPVTATLLDQPRHAQAPQLAYLSTRRERRPAYTQATLARALLEGVDAAGVPFAGPMPRYRLTPQELAPLSAYLRTLRSGSAEGVTADTLHLATVVSAEVPPARRAAMLRVLEAFVQDKNAGTRSEARRMGQGPTREYDAYRTWRLHVWELRGPRDTWRRQLEAHARRTPVFALVGGLVSGAWAPVHRFCEDHELPCLFPSTDLPLATGPGFYTLYFSRGLGLEAQALAQHLAQATPGARVAQQADHDDEGRAAADAFAALQQLEAPQRAQEGAQPASLVLWERHPDLEALAARAEAVDRVFLSGTLVGTPPAVPPRLAGKVHLVYPFALPEEDRAQHARLRAFLRRKGLAEVDTRVQANSFFAATVLGEALMRVSFNFSREYLVERIEDMLDDAVTRSVYPRVSLASGQRFASKGAYVVRVGARGELVPIGHWIVP